MHKKPKFFAIFGYEQLGTIHNSVFSGKRKMFHPLPNRNLRAWFWPWFWPKLTNLKIISLQSSFSKMMLSFCLHSQIQNLLYHFRLHCIILVKYHFSGLTNSEPKFWNTTCKSTFMNVLKLVAVWWQRST